MQLTIETLSFSDVVNYQRNGRIPDIRRQKTGESLLTSCIPHLNLYRTILCEIKIEKVFVYKIFLHENLKKKSEIIGQQFATRMQMHQSFHVTFKYCYKQPSLRVVHLRDNCCILLCVSQARFFTRLPTRFYMKHSFH